MAIVVKNLSNKTMQRKYSFTDLHLDFKETQKSENIRNNDVVAGNDLLIDADELAIQNSIRNILLQKRYLNPGFGANLRAYIGQPLSDMGARSLGETIERNLNLYEPRITVDKILVAPDYDKFQYAIVIIYRFKNFITNTVLVNGIFDASGKGDFYFIK